MHLICTYLTSDPALRAQRLRALHRRCLLLLSTHREGDGK